VKKKTKKKITLFLVDKFAWLLLLFLGKTARITLMNREYFEKAQRSGKPVLILVWHGRMLIPIYLHRNQKIYAMVSQHGDGEMIARTIQHLGYETIRGSSSRGGHEAFKGMLKALKQGKNCTILPDGPRGPRYELKMGAVLLAQRTDAVILPLCYSAKKAIQFNSWDHFNLIRPFAKVYAAYGEPLLIPRKISVEQLEEQRLRVEQQMNELRDSLDQIIRE